MLLCIFAKYGSEGNDGIILSCDVISSEMKATILPQENRVSILTPPCCYRFRQKKSTQESRMLQK